MKIEELKKIIETKAFVKNAEISIDTQTDPNAWLFDFRKIILNAKNLEFIADIFYESFKDRKELQLGTLEVTGIPLMIALITKFYQKEEREINGFFIRKSRKKTGLTQLIEGVVQKDKDIILVDDILNSGNSFWRQIEVLEELGHQVNTVWSIIRYRDVEYYERFLEQKIHIQSIFTLNDFTKDLGIKNLIDNKPKLASPIFTMQWKFKGSNPSYAHVVSKSQPALDEKKIYVGSDDQKFLALNQEDGTVAWQYAVGPSVIKKSIFSNPVLYKNLVIFGAYDGNIYALNKKTGLPNWICSEADWVGSSPAVAEGLGLVFIGLEFGLFRRHGGIIALEIETGKKVWADYKHPAFTHSSPRYISEHAQVVVGSNDGRVRLYNAKTGVQEWEFVTSGGQHFDSTLDQGFGFGDIKESFAYNNKHDVIVFGSMDGSLYILKRKTGELMHRHECYSGIWATPCMYNNKVYFTSTDKYLRCIDLDSLLLVFEKNLDGSRIFSSPVIINGKMYVGTNAGRLHEMIPESGELLGYFQTIERITNSVVYNAKTDTYFLPTFANELICLKRIPNQKGI